MIENLGKEMKRYRADIKNIINDDELFKKIDIRTLELFDAIIDEVQKVVDFKGEEIKRIEEKQKMVDKQMDELSKRINNMYQDIYDEYEDFDIVCPYCNYEFSADIDENRSEITCPECNNVIELDWSGNPDGDDNDDDSGCSGNCSHCGGCDK